MSWTPLEECTEPYRSRAPCGIHSVDGSEMQGIQWNRMEIQWKIQRKFNEIRWNSPIDPPGESPVRIVPTETWERPEPGLRIQLHKEKEQMFFDLPSSDLNESKEFRYTGCWYARCTNKQDLFQCLRQLGRKRVDGTCSFGRIRSDSSPCRYALLNGVNLPRLWHRSGSDCVIYNRTIHNASQYPTNHERS